MQANPASVAATPLGSNGSQERVAPNAPPPKAMPKKHRRAFPKTLSSLFQTKSLPKESPGAASSPCPTSSRFQQPKDAMDSSTKVDSSEMLGLVQDDHKSEAAITPALSAGTYHGSPKSSPTDPEAFELPLRRPEERKGNTSFTEPPLQRPSIEGLKFTDITTTFAVDVSGSTLGPIIEQETQAVIQISSLLSAEARSRSKIIPWDHRAHKSLDMSSIRSLQSQGGGTVPEVLTVGGESTALLSKSSAWLLFTDGEIDEHNVRKFALNICGRGLHGTACIIVVFGYQAYTPLRCNVSVGLSVFSSSPDCLFLFHNIDDKNVYMLQSKGTFNKLLPEGVTEIILDKKTVWSDLPKIKYSDLARIEIPTPCKLAPDDIRLQSKRTISLRDIYNDQVDADTAAEILNNDDNLKSVLLTTHLRGRKEEVRKWISKQKLKEKDMLWVKRPDINSTATRIILELLPIIRGEKDTAEKLALQSSLRIAHNGNWLSFAGTRSVEKNKVMRRAELVQDALTRIKENEIEISRGHFSPSSLSPVSSPTPLARHCQDESPQIHRSPMKQSYTHSTHSYPPYMYSQEGPQPTSSHSSPLQGPIGPSSPSFHVGIYQDMHLDTNLYNFDTSYDHYEKLETVSEPLETDLLCMPGYRYDKRPSYGGGGRFGECPLCGDKDALLAMLLKVPPAKFNTPEFPQPDARQIVYHPLAFGTYPETDVVSSFICCDHCAYSLVRLKQSPYELEEITDAIPLIPEAFRGQFQATTLNLIDRVFKKRFERAAIEQIFLAVLYCTIWNLEESENIDLERESLSWICSTLLLQINVPLSLSSSFNSPDSTPRINPHMPLVIALSQNISSPPTTSPALLQYPLGGFVVMMLCMLELNSEPWPGARYSIIVQKLLYVLAENHHRCVAEEQVAAKKDLREFLKTAQRNDLPLFSEDSNAVETGGIIEGLCDTHLLSDEDLGLMSHLGLLFGFLKQSSGHALAAFLVLLERTSPDGFEDAMGYFERLMNMDLMVELSKNGWVVKDQGKLLDWLDENAGRSVVESLTLTDSSFVAGEGGDAQKEGTADESHVEVVLDKS